MSDQAKPEARRWLPQSELDFNLMTTDPVWGQPYVSEDLKSRLEEYHAVGTNEDGTIIYDKKSLWSILNFYSRDMRLSNLSKWDEMPYVKYYLDLANDLLLADMIRSFLICLSRAASLLEITQSKNGFLRKRMNTFTQENFKTDLEPPKKSIFGGKKKQEGY